MYNSNATRKCLPILENASLFLKMPPYSRKSLPILENPSLYSKRPRSFRSHSLLHSRISIASDNKPPISDSACWRPRVSELRRTTCGRGCLLLLKWSLKCLQGPRVEIKDNWHFQTKTYKTLDSFFKKKPILIYLYLYLYLYTYTCIYIHIPIPIPKAPQRNYPSWVQCSAISETRLELQTTMLEFQRSRLELQRPRLEF